MAKRKPVGQQNKLFPSALDLYGYQLGLEVTYGDQMGQLSLE